MSEELRCILCNKTQNVWLYVPNASIGMGQHEFIKETEPQPVCQTCRWAEGLFTQDEYHMAVRIIQSLLPAPNQASAGVDYLLTRLQFKLGVPELRAPSFNRISVQGEPLSEMIIRERR